MAQIQPPNTQTLRPQHLTQVGHEGNPVETCALAVTGTLDSPSYYSCEGADAGGPVLYPVTGTGDSSGSSSATPISLPVLGSSGEMDCQGSASVSLSVTGGTEPFTWSTTLGTLSSSGRTATLTPPANPGPNVVGDAYGRVIRFCFGLGFGDCHITRYGCDGSIKQLCTQPNSLACYQQCNGASASCAGDPTTPPAATVSTGTNACVNIFHIAAGDVCGSSCTCDLRSAQMISDGCSPCQLSFAAGAVVTVTDAEGRSAYITIERAD